MTRALIFLALLCSCTCSPNLREPDGKTSLRKAAVKHALQVMEAREAADKAAAMSEAKASTTLEKEEATGKPKAAKKVEATGKPKAAKKPEDQEVKKVEVVKKVEASGASDEPKHMKKLAEKAAAETEAKKTPAPKVVKAYASEQGATKKVHMTQDEIKQRVADEMKKAFDTVDKFKAETKALVDEADASQGATKKAPLKHVPLKQAPKAHDKPEQRPAEHAVEIKKSLDTVKKSKTAAETEAKKTPAPKVVKAYTSEQGATKKAPLTHVPLKQAPKSHDKLEQRPAEHAAEIKKALDTVKKFKAAAETEAKKTPAPKVVKAYTSEQGATKKAPLVHVPLKQAPKSHDKLEQRPADHAVEIKKALDTVKKFKAAAETEAKKKAAPKVVKAYTSEQGATKKAPLIHVPLKQAPKSHDKLEQRPVDRAAEIEKALDTAKAALDTMEKFKAAAKAGTKKTPAPIVKKIPKKFPLTVHLKAVPNAHDKLEQKHVPLQEKAAPKVAAVKRKPVEAFKPGSVRAIAAGYELMEAAVQEQGKAAPVDAQKLNVMQTQAQVGQPAPAPAAPSGTIPEMDWRNEYAHPSDPDVLKWKFTTHKPASSYGIDTKAPPKLLPIGEGAYQDPKAVKQRTTDTIMDCQDGKWNDCYLKHGGDFLDGYGSGRLKGKYVDAPPPKKSGAAATSLSLVAASLLCAAFMV